MHVVVADPIHPVGIERLEAAGHTVVQVHDQPPAALEAELARAHALVVRSATTVSTERIEAAPELRVIARAGIGVDNIDLEAAAAEGIVVVNAPEGGARAVSEHTIALAFALVRDIPRTDRRTRAGRWPKAGYDGGELAGSTLGIVGLGRIGTLVAEKARALEMRVVGHDPDVAPGEVTSTDLRPFEETLDAADILTVHTPLTPETADLIDAGALARLEGGYLINCSRGGIVDEEALVDALERDVLAGAALDVFASEPLEADHPLTAQERVILTPHVAGSSDRAQATIGRSVAEQVTSALEGEPVAHPVDAAGGRDV